MIAYIALLLVPMQLLPVWRPTAMAYWWGMYPGQEYA